MDKARGGTLVTNVMTHFLYPSNDATWNEVTGFNAAGGLPGPKFDFNEHPEGDMAVATKYMKARRLPVAASTPAVKRSRSSAARAAGRTGRAKSSTRR